MLQRGFRKGQSTPFDYIPLNVARFYKRDLSIIIFLMLH